MEWHYTVRTEKVIWTFQSENYLYIAVGLIDRSTNIFFLILNTREYCWPFTLSDLCTGLLEQPQSDLSLT